MLSSFDNPPIRLCPPCGNAMKVVRVVPRLGAFLPELLVFRCPSCGEVETKEYSPEPARPMRQSHCPNS